MTDDIKSLRRLVLVLFFILMTGFFMVGGYLLDGQRDNVAQTARISVNTDRLDANAVIVEQATYESCLRSITARTQFNDLLNALTKVDEDGIALEPENVKLTAVRLERIAAYQAGKLEIPVCEALKP